MTRVNRSHSAAWIFMDTLIMNDAHTQYVTADVTIPSGPFLSICGTVMYCHYAQSVNLFVKVYKYRVQTTKAKNKHMLPLLQ